MSAETWLGSNHNVVNVGRSDWKAILAWNAILEKGTSITFRDANGNNSVTQLVRVESDDRSSVPFGASGIAPKRQVIIFGVKDHPNNAVADTILKEGYIFNIDKDRYVIKDVIEPPELIGEIQGLAEATR